MVMPAGTVFLTPLDGALLLFLLPGLLFPLRGSWSRRGPVLSSHSANRGMPRILVSMEASFFPSLFSRWMERLAVSRTEATCPGASSRRLPQLLMYHMELSWNTNKVRLRPASSIHTPSSMNGIPIRVQTNVEPAIKRRCPSHDNGCQHHNKGKHPLDAPKHGDYFPFPYNDDWLLHFFRLFVSAEQ